MIHQPAVPVQEMEQEVADGPRRLQGTALRLADIAGPVGRGAGGDAADALPAASEAN